MIPLFPHPQHPSYAHRGLHLRWSLGFLRAQFLYRPIWSLKSVLGLGPKVFWGKRVSFLSSVRAVGNGSIRIGDDCIFDSKPDLYTHSKNAVLSLGAKTYINGSRFGCSVSISIGEDCILADVRMTDSDFHSLRKDRNLKSAPVKTAPIVVERNVWISAGSALLKGVHIGEDSVIAFGSVVVGSVPSGKIFAGNPAKEIGNIPT